MVKAVIAGWAELSGRSYPHTPLAALHTEAARAALDHAGLGFADVDGYFCAGDAPGIGPFSMVEYMGLSPRYLNSTEIGGAAYHNHLITAVAAIEAGLCEVALITCAGRSRSAPQQMPYRPQPAQPEWPFEAGLSLQTVMPYALVAARYLYEYGLSPDVFAPVKVTASRHAAHNPNAFLRKAVTEADHLASSPLCDPLRVMDACVVCDGAGAVVVSRADRLSPRMPHIRLAGAAQTLRHSQGTAPDGFIQTAARQTGPDALRQAGLRAGDIRYASIYDSFTITVLLALEDLGFCKPGQAGAFVRAGGIEAKQGPVAVNTDGGGLCSSHIAGRGGMPRLIEALRQLSGTAAPALQIPDLSHVMVHGTGGFLGLRHAAVTLILERA